MAHLIIKYICQEMFASRGQLRGNKSITILDCSRDWKKGKSFKHLYGDTPRTKELKRSVIKKRLLNNWIGKPTVYTLWHMAPRQYCLVYHFVTHLFTYVYLLTHLNTSISHCYSYSHHLVIVSYFSLFHITWSKCYNFNDNYIIALTAAQTENHCGNASPTLNSSSGSEKMTALWSYILWSYPWNITGLY